MPLEESTVSSVIEFTMQAKPGHYDDVLAAYGDFAAALQVAVPEDRLILLTGSPASGLIRGIGVFSTAQIAEDVNSMPFFAAFNDAVAPFLAGTPERTEMDLIHMFVAE